MNESNQAEMNIIPRPTPVAVLTLANTLTHFDAAMSHVLNVEGRKYTNHPADKGGPTKFGITLGSLKDWRGKNVTAKDVENLTEEEARQIYKARYWDKANLGFLSNGKVSMALMDQVVQRGVKGGITLCQVMLNSQSRTSLLVDGVMGPKTRNAIELLNEEFFCREFIQAAQHKYLDNVLRDSSQIVFLRGWLNRTHILQDMLTFGTSVGEPIMAPKPMEFVAAVKKKDPMAPFKWMKAEMGVSEIAGSKDNARIVYYHGFTTLKATDDETPWCSAVMCAAAENSGFASTRSAAAKSWRTYGEEGDGSVGDIACFTRAGGNHVALVAEKYRPGTGLVKVLGGNQGNAVRISEYPENRLVCFRRFA